MFLFTVQVSFKKNLRNRRKMRLQFPEGDEDEEEDEDVDTDVVSDEFDGEDETWWVMSYTMC